MSKRTWLIGYFLIFVGVYILDQASKLQTQKNYMAYSDPTDSQVYENSSRYVWGGGNSPTKIRNETRKKSLQSSSESGSESNVEVNTEVSKNWIDFELTYVRNHGAVWGIFSGLSEKFRLALFFTVTFLAVIGVGIMFWKSSPEQRIYRAALAFILAGAIGNFTDRVMLKYVIDWIHFQWNVFGWEYSFPVFNVADISIDVGIGLMLVDAIFQGVQQETPPSKSSENLSALNSVKV